MGGLSGYLFGVFQNVLLRVFFRHVDVVGSFRIPDEGPVMFVANHSNQFVDPMMISKFTGKPVRFLCAAKSLRRPAIGGFARACNAIGVERPQDLAFKGRGEISVEAGGTEVTGVGTAFSTDLQAGSKIKATGAELLVKSVESDTSCTVASAEGALSKAGYKILPKVDQADTFSAVYSALEEKGYVGIFPEGGSHDNTGLLDLKPGVAIMCLGAMAAGSAPVRIVPCGLTYFEPHRFRSRAFVEFGQPIEVQTSLAERYKSDRRGAVAELMGLVNDSMNAVVPGVQDYSELQAIVTLRALYKPRGHVLSAEEALRLTKYFKTAARLFRDHASVQRVIGLAQEYNDMLKSVGYRDRDVRQNMLSSRSVTGRVFCAALQVLLLAPLAIPAMVLALPITLVTTILAERERVKALAGSTVKVRAMDVIASYKILVALGVLPIYNLLLAVLICWFCGLGLLACLGIFLVEPQVQYSLVLVCDRFVLSLLRCRAAVHFLGGQQSARELVERRAQLQLLVRSMVDELGPQLSADFESQRVVPQNLILQDNLALLDAGLVAEDPDSDPVVVKVPSTDGTSGTNRFVYVALPGSAPKNCQSVRP